MINSPEKNEILALLERGVLTALETYSNVHRGSGFKSVVTTHLFEQARDIVLGYLGIKNTGFVVIFCIAMRAEILKKNLNPESYKIVSSKDIGLSIGVSALAVKRKALPKGIPFQTGGGTTKLISKDWVEWTNAPDKFEAGTPAIINIITFAGALQLIKKSENNIFKNSKAEKLTIEELLYHDKLDEFSGKELLAELRKTIIGRDIKVPTTEGAKTFINLDNSASTPTFEPVWNTYRKSINQSPQIQQEIIQEVKSLCAKFLNASQTEYEIIFTSNTTEAINLVAGNLRDEFDKETGMVVINTLLEHSSNDLPWRMVPNSTLVRLSVDNEGFVDLNELEAILKKYNSLDSIEKKRVKLVAISGASNVLGVCNNIVEISRTVHKYGAQLLVDGAQLIAHRKIDMEASKIDFLAFSAHKLYAPFGCGVLIARKSLLKINETELKTIKLSGEENVAGIAALGKILVLIQRIGLENIQKEETDLTVKTLNALSQIAGIRIYGINTPEHPKFDYKIGVILFGIEGVMANQVAGILSLQSGIGVRYGCHCAHIIIKHLLNVSPGLEKFQRFMLTVLPKISLPGLTRVSLGIENTEEDIDKLVEALNKIIKKVNTKNTLPKSEVQKQITALLNDSALKVYSNIA
jgi:selenocysteine lyase/cysteine desulfurase